MKIIQAIAICGLLVLATACAASNGPVFATDVGAIRGYDPVAYQTELRPVKGDPAYQFVYDDATWYFASEENLTLFRKDPERYAPQYGGYCAYAMSKGHVAPTDPQAWHVTNDKLYLNYSLGVRETWLKDIPGYVTKADVNWRNKNAKPGSK